ncbi:methyl-accepting chemotaxis protein [Oribacterium sp. WCC10]|uniref:methyl-accepting chemotaxis protein n=1 Tax=Oribacterium sp. WCC10 TaxID=1855343 RepID=UPI0008E86E0A|nr:methyl-accepting chemotaxis protein [Oribacterium sp. WCC10]SFG23876.1 Methyl-accepting chemotaxis protein (MCP) signalling domain-containing protein [Oribacterium sp. WCC10]
MKINEFCNLSELTSTIKNWSALTGLKVDVKNSDGEIIASTVSAEDNPDNPVGSDDGEAASDDSFARTINIDIKLNDEVIGTTVVTESGGNAANMNAAMPLLDELVNNFVLSQYFKYANEKVLSHLSDGIAQTIDLVKEVTSSTNNLKEIQKRQKIVAINASIEAARAGQAGRSFTVVAEEVKKLSDASSEANGKIERVVNQIRNIVSTLSLDSSENV